MRDILGIFPSNIAFKIPSENFEVEFSLIEKSARFFRFSCVLCQLLFITANRSYYLIIVDNLISRYFQKVNLLEFRVNMWL